MTKREWKVGDAVPLRLVGKVTAVTGRGGTRIGVEWPEPLAGETVHVGAGETPNGAARTALDPHVDDERDWLVWFACNADFGPADGDVRDSMRRSYERETGKRVPRGWRGDEE